MDVQILNEAFVVLILQGAVQFLRWLCAFHFQSQLVLGPLDTLLIKPQNADQLLDFE